MMDPVVLFIGLVFVAMFLLMQGVMGGAFGTSGRMQRRLRRRIDELAAAPGGETPSLLRQRYLERLTPLGRRLEALPGMLPLRRVVEQAGLDQPAHRIALQGLVLAALALVSSIAGGLGILLAAGMALVAGALPFLRLMVKRAQRVTAIEEALPDAIDMIKRSVRAGHPFIAAIKLVGEDMEGPIGQEFAATAADFAYGSDPRAALLGLVGRVPSAPLMGFVTAVLIQRETGGNLAEILENITQVIRGRQRFQRKIRTLSAEGRVSAWVLTLVPVILAGVLHLTSPQYLPVLFEHPRGLTMLAVCIGLMAVGVLWMRKIIRIEV
ncbi:MAG: type II secretion system F family protein [Gammaproteobacteria bacterium]